MGNEQWRLRRGARRVVGGRKIWRWEEGRRGFGSGGRTFGEGVVGEYRLIIWCEAVRYKIMKAIYIVIAKLTNCTLVNGQMAEWLWRYV